MGLLSGPLKHISKLSLTYNLRPNNERNMNVVSQLRIYTINRNMMDSWLKLFHEHIEPTHEKYGISIDGSWVNDARTEFVWLRSFDSLEDIQIKESQYYGSSERKALGDQPQTHIAKIEVRIIEPTSF